MALFEICGVSKGFDQNGQPKSRASRAVGSTPDLIRGLPVLRNNLAFNENEFVCIVGRSGSEKTTLISLIAGLLQPDEEQILLEGKPIEGRGRTGGEYAKLTEGTERKQWASIVHLTGTQLIKK